MLKTYLKELKKIDVIMPVWSTDDETVRLTEAAIDSLEGHRLIIVDNGSTVGGGLLRERADLYIRNKENLGYAKAVNQGLKLAGDIVAVANNDVRVSPNWWDVAKTILEKDSVGSVHFRMIPYTQPFNPGQDIWFEGRERWCSSSFFVMKNTQLYDENFLNSYDDYDFWFRFREKGLSTAYTNLAEYQHLDSYTQQKRMDRSENDKRNYEYYKKKYGEYPDIQFERMYPEQMNTPWKPMP